MIQRRTRRYHGIKPVKYEMAKRKENWNSLNDRLVEMVVNPPEKQYALMQDAAPKHCCPQLAEMLGVRGTTLTIPPDQKSMSVETVIPFVPIKMSSTDIEKCPKAESQQSTIKRTLSHSTSSSDTSQEEVLELQVSETTSKQWTDKTETQFSSESSVILSEYVEVEKEHAYNKKLLLEHKAIRRFLERPSEEVATWLKKDVKVEKNEMTFEEQGVQRINKIAADFCEWVRGLGGDEQSFVSEEVLKELFQIEMDYPAARAFRVHEKEKRVLYPRLAMSLEVPGMSYLETLSKQLNWDAQVEKEPSKLRAFGKQLPTDLHFKTPQYKTTETWLEWNQLSDQVMSFADVYGPVRDLRSTQEYCSWLRNHPEHPRPRYLVDQGVFTATVPESHEGTALATSSRLTLMSGVSLTSTPWRQMQ